LALAHEQLRILFSVHPNPAVRETVRSKLAGVRGVSLLDAPAYGEWVRLLLKCDAILTDSGGLQEEGTALGKPILVLRASTERPEALQVGSATMVGTDRDNIVSAVRMLMTDRETYTYMATPREVFGDGFAAERIVARLAADLRRPPARCEREALAGSVGMVGRVGAARRVEA
jgi:UDP-N-acetylglucosamine 2-epimerase (non-hydrolysing)